MLQCQILIPNPNLNKARIGLHFSRKCLLPCFLPGAPYSSCLPLCASRRGLARVPRATVWKAPAAFVLPPASCDARNRWARARRGAAHLRWLASDCCRLVAGDWFCLFVVHSCSSKQPSYLMRVVCGDIRARLVGRNLDVQTLHSKRFFTVAFCSYLWIIVQSWSN